MLGLSSVITTILKVFSFSKDTWYQVVFTMGLDCQEVWKLSSVAKSMIHISSLQEASVCCRLARLEEMTGASAGGSGDTGPSFFQIFPMSASAARALSSMRPSRLGATFR